MFHENKIGIIDLETHEIGLSNIPEGTRRMFLGGRGINMLLLYHLTSPETNPLSSENPLIIGIGLLSGMLGPAASRCSISGKSPETGLLGDSNIGGNFSSALRRSGFEHLVIKGKSERPVYIYIEEGGVEIKDAADLWGRDSIETLNYFKEYYGRDCELLCIGQAGENLVCFAGIRHGLKNIAGRTGMGCVMGSKKLKAIVVKKGRAHPFRFSTAFKGYVKSLNSLLKDTRTSGVLHKYGTPFLYDMHNRWGVLRTYNGQMNAFKRGRRLSAPFVRDHYKGARACFSCPIACRHLYESYGGLNEGPEYGMLGAFGPICGIERLEAILIINERLNRYGMDCCSTGNLIAWAMELYQRKIIDKTDTGGLSLEWGNEEVVKELIDQIVYRKGFGAILADGAKAASEKIGRESKEYLIWSKYLPQSDSVDVRAFKGFALGVATATRGADHLRSRPTIEALNLDEEVLKGILNDTEVSNDPTSYKGKAKMVWWSEINYTLADAMGICRFAQKFNSIENLGLEEFAQLIFYATEMELSIDELIKIGERILTLERMFLKREGIDRQFDTLPERYFKEPMPDGRFKGEKIDRDAFNMMLDEYYNLHNWDCRSGVPTDDLVEILGLNNSLSNFFRSRMI